MLFDRNLADSYWVLSHLKKNLNFLKIGLCFTMQKVLEQSNSSNNHPLAPLQGALILGRLSFSNATID
jgi:hypothetical protein